MRKLLASLFLVFISISSIGQDVSMENIVQPVPEIASLTKALTYSASTFIGKPDISIPIYEIKTKNFSIPINLAYDASGIHVDDCASWVGMNWSLSAGGMISRSVVGVPDEEVGGYLNFPPPIADNLADTYQNLNYLLNVNGLGQGDNQSDTGPDQFQFSFNGKSGTFVFKSDGSILQIPETSYKISYANNIFKIIDDEGITYIFSALETTQVYSVSQRTYPVGYSYSSSTKDIVTAWGLTEMISNDGTEHVYFNYSQGWNGSKKTNSFLESDGYHSTTTGAEYGRFWFGTELSTLGQNLESIVFTNGKIEFGMVADRLDDMGTRLNNITIYRQESTSYIPLRSYQLVQGYYYSSDDYITGVTTQFPPTTRDRYRLRLDELQFKDANDNKVSSYKFQYNQTMLPSKTSCAQDWWGYGNGKYENKTLVPSSYDSYRNGNIGGADRTPNENYMKAGILEKIIYPTGGYSVFNMEAHQYNNGQHKKITQSYGGTAWGYDQPGLVHKVVKTFTTSSDLVSGSGQISVTITPYTTYGNPSYTSSEDNQNASLYPTPVIILKNLTSPGQDVTYPDPNTQSDPSKYYSFSGACSLSPGTTYELSILCYVNKDGVLATGQINYDEFTDEEANEIAGGLRVNSIQHYTSDGKMATQQVYKYGKDEKGDGIYLGLTNFITYYGNNVFYSVGHITAGSLVSDNWSSEMIYDQILFQGSPVVYSNVTTYESNETDHSNGRTIDYYGEGPYAQTAPLYAGLTDINNCKNHSGLLFDKDYWKWGHLLSQEQDKLNEDKTFSPVTKITNTYNTQKTDASYGLLTAPKILHSPATTEEYTIDDFTNENYYINTGYVQLINTLKEDYLPSLTNPLITNTTYSYDNTYHNLLTETSTQNSIKQTVTAQLKYPFNNSQIEASGSLTPDEANVLNEMVNRNMISSVIEQTKSINEQLMTRKRTMYGFTDPDKKTIAPSYIELQNRTNSPTKEIVFNNYDSKGNLTQQQKRNDFFHSYVWDYSSTYPVAEVKNATSSQIAYTSFESDGAGNWIINSGAATANGGATGTKGFILGGNNSISKTGFPIGNYIVSYWLKTGSGSGSVTVNGNSGTAITTKNGWTLYSQTLTNTSNVTISGTATIDELRLYPSSAQMTSYTYQPLVGMTSQCDASNHITYYEYDGSQRLSLIRDQDYNIIKKICYNYAGQPLACSGLVVLTEVNSITEAVSVKFTNTSTNQITTFDVPVTSDLTHPVQFGTLSPGIYNIEISRFAIVTDGGTIIGTYGAATLDYCNSSSALNAGTPVLLSNVEINETTCNSFTFKKDVPLGP